MFTPKKKSEFQDKIKKYLLEGYIIRCNSIETDPLEVIDRAHLGLIPNSGNIGSFDPGLGQKKGSGITEKIVCSHSNLHNVVAELKKDYSVSEVSCRHSGCCQYSTYAYYLD